MTKVKICGLKEKEHLAATVAAGADYLGFVFAPSKRQVTIDEAKELVATVPANVQTVGVFVSPSLADLLDHIEQVPLDVVQVHGDWDESMTERLPVPVIRAVQVTADQDLPATKADYLLFDAPVAGSGKTFDWQLLEGKALSKPFFVAGGLTAHNVAEAIRTFTPYAVDVSSGVETDGRKDTDKIRAFIAQAKGTQ